MIPKSYIPAQWRGTTAVEPDTKCIGISLNLNDGKVMRFKLDRGSAHNLAESILEFQEISFQSPEPPEQYFYCYRYHPKGFIQRVSARSRQVALDIAKCYRSGNIDAWVEDHDRNIQ